MTLEKLKDILDEENYPFFEDEYLLKKVEEYNQATEEERTKIILILLETKSGIPEFEVCGMKIPAPTDYFLRKMRSYRKNMTGYVVREDRL